MNKVIYFSGEDAISAALAERCVATAMPHFHMQNIQPRQGGKEGVLKLLTTYFGMAKEMPFLLMLDQDTFTCPPSFREKILNDAKVKTLPNNLLISIVPRESEAWILGDHGGISSLFNIPFSKIPDNPESLDDPKQVLVNLARKTKSIRDEVCPASNTSAKVGPGYNDVMTRFVRTVWRPEEAAKRCKSLDRTLKRLKQLGEI